MDDQCATCGEVISAGHRCPCYRAPAAAHTPGPWQMRSASKYAQAGVSAYPTGDGRNQVSVALCGYGDTATANAALIAKAPIAPKLAEALREARKALYIAVEAAVDLKDFDAADHVVIRQIDAALAEWEAQ